MALDPILYLDTETVAHILDSLDVTAVVHEGLRENDLGRTVLPEEAYLRWDVPGGGWARSLCLPAALGQPTRAAGVKVINGNLANPGRGLPRASGLFLTFDVDTGRINTIMAAADLSAIRTAAVSAVAATLLAPSVPRHVLILGAGPLGIAHARVLPRALPALVRVSLYDLEPTRIEAAIESLAGQPVSPTAVAADDLDATLAAADVIIAATTSSAPYLTAGGVRPGTLIVNVGLDDCADDLILECDLLIVDSWQLVAADDRRAVGRLFHSGRICAPDTPAGDAVGRRVDAELPALVSGRLRLTAQATDRVIVNPFGMAVHDVALGAEVDATARSLGLGTWLSR
jgi:ornithine cyclodeaminase/alanine dehydrogenase-like protein (mu-crystallin family)